MLQTVTIFISDTAREDGKMADEKKFLVSHACDMAERRMRQIDRAQANGVWSVRKCKAARADCVANWQHALREAQKAHA